MYRHYCHIEAHLDVFNSSTEGLHTHTHIHRMWITVKRGGKNETHECMCVERVELSTKMRLEVMISVCVSLLKHTFDDIFTIVSFLQFVSCLIL